MGLDIFFYPTFATTLILFIFGRILLRSNIITLILSVPSSILMSYLMINEIIFNEDFLK